MVAVANTKMMVRPTSRMLSAISFGVFCRSAPSTSLIMRSRKVEPGAAVMRTRIQSDSTCVPPVTAERSPPDSRMTGADSPVIAASLTEAMPSIDLAVGRDDVAGLDQHDVADLEAGAGHQLVSPCGPLRSAASPASRCGSGAARRPAPCRGLRRPLRRSWRTAP